MEVQHFFVPTGSCLHLTVRLVSDAMVDKSKVSWGKELVDWFLEWMLLETWQENTFIVVSLNKGVSCVSICSNSGQNDESIIVLKSDWLHD